MLHIVMEIRPTPLRPAGIRWEGPAESLADAVVQAKQKMREGFADPVELQNEDRSTLLDKAAFTAEINK